MAFRGGVTLAHGLLFVVMSLVSMAWFSWLAAPAANDELQFVPTSALYSSEPSHASAAHVADQQTR